MRKKTDFAAAFKKAKEPMQPARAEAPVVNATRRPSRQGTMHIGGHFDPAVIRQLRRIAADENTSIQVLLGQAINMLFIAKGEPPIAREEPIPRT